MLDHFVSLESIVLSGGQRLAVDSEGRCRPQRVASPSDGAICFTLRAVVSATLE